MGFCAAAARLRLTTTPAAKPVAISAPVRIDRRIMFTPPGRSVAALTIHLNTGVEARPARPLLPNGYANGSETQSKTLGGSGSRNRIPFWQMQTTQMSKQCCCARLTRASSRSLNKTLIRLIEQPPTRGIAHADAGQPFRRYFLPSRRHTAGPGAQRWPRARARLPSALSLFVPWRAFSSPSPP